MPILRRASRSHGCATSSANWSAPSATPGRLAGCSGVPARTSSRTPSGGIVSPRKLLIAVLAITVAACGVAAPAQAAKKLEITLQDDGVLLYQQYSNRDFALQRARDIGVSRLRVNVIWHQTLATSGQNVLVKPPKKLLYDWTRW